MSKLHPMLEAYQPTGEDPFDRVKAGHLLSRAGFGGTDEEIEKVMKLGPAGAVDWLMDFPDAPVDEEDATDVPDLSMLEGVPKSFREIRRELAGKSQEEKKLFRRKLQMQNREAVGAIISWWLGRMARGPYPLQEKLTLFWHGHFTTSAREERAALLMWNQQELLRRSAAGNFRTLLHEISRDPAMLDYLNNTQNVKAHANENYAREVMELFTMGLGNYTEDDVKQVARCFTGWTHDGEAFVFRRFEHDDGEKVVFGQRGNFGGDDVLEMILAHPACAKHIARGLFSYFGYEQPEEELVDSLGEKLREGKWALRPVIRTMLTSRAFYSERAIGGQIKSPVQLVVGTVRMLDLEMPDGRVMVNYLNQMGQVPLMPPNVKGWPGGRMWINTSTLFVRYNTAMYLAGGAVPPVAGKTKQNKFVDMRVRRVGPVNFDPKVEEGSAEEVAGGWLDRLVQRPVEERQKRVLVDVIREDPRSEGNLRKMVQLIVSMPEYQLC